MKRRGPILERLSAMREFVAQLRQYQAKSFDEFLSDPTLRAAVEGLDDFDEFARHVARALREREKDEAG